jgi:hypothetical protein
MKLEVGKTYRDRTGRSRTIKKVCGLVYFADDALTPNNWWSNGRINDSTEMQGDLIEEVPTIVDLIRAVIEGKQLQQVIHYVTEGTKRWEDLGDPDCKEETIRFLLDWPARPVRVKPEPAVYWFPVVKKNEGQISVGDHCASKEKLPKELYAGPVTHHLRLELDSDIAAVISAKTEAP